MSEPKPATSVHFTYAMPMGNIEDAKDIEFHNTVTVKCSANTTYFSVIQFSPGGYCGIQERDGAKDRLAIFSLWNHTQNNAELVDKGPDTSITTFGGEGTGLKCMRPFQWQLNEPISFTVKGRKQDDGVWHISCDVISNGLAHHMATYSRRGQHPMKSMTCFVEDWNRCKGAKGVDIQRMAYYSDAHCVIDGVKTELRKAKFTKVEWGLDSFGGNRCNGLVLDDQFCLQTGGDKSCAAPLPNGTLLTLNPTATGCD